MLVAQCLFMFLINNFTNEKFLFLRAIIIAFSFFELATSIWSLPFLINVLIILSVIPLFLLFANIWSKFVLFLLLHVYSMG